HPHNRAAQRVRGFAMRVMGLISSLVISRWPFADGSFALLDLQAGCLTDRVIPFLRALRIDGIACFFPDRKYLFDYAFTQFFVIGFGYVDFRHIELCSGRAWVFARVAIHGV